MLYHHLGLLVSFIAGVWGQTTPSFDYIVVGSGAGGGSVAVALAEKKYNVLLVEAGPDYSSYNITVPGFHVRSNEDPNIAWDFFVKHYDESTGIRQKVLYPRASGIGGSTLHNAMINMLPNTRDYKKMVELMGDEGWNESNMRKIFDKITGKNAWSTLAPFRLLDQLGPNAQNLSAYIASQLNGNKDKDAWLRLTSLNAANLLALDPKVLDLAANLLLKPVLSSALGFDINSPGLGEGPLQKEQDFFFPQNIDPRNSMQRTGLYGRIIKARKELKLTVWTDTLVTKVLLDGNNKAYGIAYCKGAKLYRAGKVTNDQKGECSEILTKKEIIISGGTFNTPQIMMLSGIGDSDHLKAMNITPKVHLPGVGRNLHDRYEISVNFQFDTPFGTVAPCTFLDTPQTDPCLKRFVETQSGPYTFNGVLGASLRKSIPTLTESDLVYFYSPIFFRGYHPGMGAEAAARKDILSALVLKAHTFNRAGRVRLNSGDPFDAPDINFRYFTDGENQDMNAMIKGIRDLREKASRFKAPHREIIPGPQVQSDAQLKDYIINNAWGHHATGTMKIGKDSDPMACLDNKFRVRGTKNLRVVDLSVLPDIPGYFPVLYLYLIGTKAADVISASF